MSTRTSFPPVRAVIFDMDGLLIDSEDAYTRVTNTILRENGRPDLPWTIKAQLQGRPNPEAVKIFQAWAKLPISSEEFNDRQRKLQAEEFTKVQPLPGVEKLLQTLSTARTAQGPRGHGLALSNQGRNVHMAVATSSHTGNYKIKTAHLQSMFAVFPPSQVIVGDDARVPKGRGKPLPDIYLLALQVLNDQIAAEGDEEKSILPEECLVFEDSVPGVEAGRRAGMRVLWCPHPGLLDVYKDRVDEVLAGRTGEHKETDLDHQGGAPLAGSPGHVGELRDEWGQIVTSLEDFDYKKYGLETGNSQAELSNEQPSTPIMTDKQLEEMTAMADGKIHSQAEGTR